MTGETDDNGCVVPKLTPTFSEATLSPVAASSTAIRQTDCKYHTRRHSTKLWVSAH